MSSWRHFCLREKVNEVDDLEKEDITFFPAILTAFFHIAPFLLSDLNYNSLCSPARVPPLCFSLHGGIWSEEIREANFTEVS